ncbi:acetylornithine aminotransferase [Oleiphilus sp. HI0071]|jgi:acetylornithine/N-succinyldiaminopimelate aminotransferase|uniref:aspartate aminotransferase family protein n=1 Tax=unclassified Oleiphilus TaxID=2631174 RepID=UPI0007C3017F|nr:MULTISPECIES: aspartate aminotransferase family protein [unclassified Oleiphilus]KZY66414.1 acetylornithine aminotransferase [Oleiphilus sp. HI0065]KZY80483.1 acetylornithine aminotransferase [Oleiphilus sp. HI0071]KZZ05019.1 acetylornithine aminotransferase [Oleiphilus sp. HI0073]KZZ45026.1 acetylornithine aminotransferase [Oleiphilus sp. HI0118]KZZ49223.1 acetylornithine aminotransferase [Oleiphilus sp. HI0122]KZZ67803.1 acetylornithine aminotransferase [Oleiphilus sp. HI0130]KZZ81070.1
MSHELHPSRSVFDQVMVPNYAPSAVIPVRGQGSRVWDQEGKEYIDFAGGIAVSALGHVHPRLVSTLKEQAEKLWHVSNVMTNEPALRLASLLTENTFADRVFFANSGAEANEAAFKLVRKYAHDHYGAEKNEILSFYGSFHGRTLFTVSVGGQAKYTEGFEPVPGGIKHATFNDLASVEALISEKTCAVVLEPVQGEGGVKPADPEFLKGLRALCDKHNALLVLDEIQTGVGRSGALYAYQKYGVIPDILTTAKSLGGGFPVGAMLTSEKVAQSFGVGTHGSTYGGNPLACAVAEALILELLENNVISEVEAKHSRFMSGLEAINKRYGVFKEIRSCGLLIGCEMAEAYQGKAKDILVKAMDEGLMVLIAGPNVLRMAPSLIIADGDIDAGMARLDQAISLFVGTEA